MKKIIRKSRIPESAVLLTAALILTSAGCGWHKENNVVYVHKKAGLALNYPAKWNMTEQPGSFTTVNFQTKKKDELLVLQMHGAKDYDLLTNEFGLELFSDKMRSSGMQWNISSSNSIITNGLSGVKFELSKDSSKKHGFYAIKNRYEICLTSDADSGMLETALQNLRIQDLPFKTDARPEDLLSSDNWSQTLKYGRELLQTRDINVENYHLAKEQFRLVLRSARMQSPLPLEYAEAWHLLEIAKTVQNEAFNEAKIRVVRHLGMSELKDARKTADYMMDLIADRHDARYQEANKLYNKAVR